MFAILGTLVVVFAFSVPSQAALSDEYQNEERLSAINESDCMLYWTYDKTDSTISFAAKARTSGWVGLGFTSKIDNTTTYDVVRGSDDDLTKKKEIYDFHAVGKQTPVNDTQQNLIEKSVAENNYYTTIKFKRALDTKDSNDTVIKPGPMIVVWSYGNIEELESTYKEMGYKTVTLIPEEQKNDTTSSTATPETTNGPVSKAVVRQDSWQLLALSAILFIVPALRP
ncbi:DBH-like monooxygenase protein 2 homolog [Actinia tenebrosa]|uniref:DBH-like monooxygenase protein 2 homolog n=1 Tax=Actinia tenebrosa TaxID=6105 RepID=A0A6P8HF57_ACTTE|nr:DBH-like monooxygenase protein 2 homolog [Actinia tenebrosa]